MRNSKKTNDALIKIIVAVALLAIVILLCCARDNLIAKTCVDMPAPEETVSEFFDALKDGRYEDCDTLLSNYSTLGLTSSTDTAIGAKVYSMLTNSYEYYIINDTYQYTFVSASDLLPENTSAVAAYSSISSDELTNAVEQNGDFGKIAYQTITFTYLDISSMSDDLHSLVTDIAYSYAYEAIDINNEETATQVVLDSLDSISSDIEKYYRTDIFVIKLEYINGQWKIVLDDALYKAIIGNIA